MKARMTPFFPAEASPARVGLYQVAGDNGLLFQYWNGIRWGVRRVYPHDAFRLRNGITKWPKPQWRGFAADPNGAKP